MTTSTNSIRVIPLRKSLPLVLAIGALSVLSARAHAADFDKITLSAPVVKTIGYEEQTAAPIQETTVTARVTADDPGLTTNSGVALLRASVLDAARKACEAANPFDPDGGACVQTAVKAAQPQINAAIARARSNLNG
jgi:UrcA family protein